MAKTLRIEIASDVICPWCYIGKRRFEQALAKFPGKEQVQVVWRSFELDPDAPSQREGTLQEHLAKKYHVSLEEAAAMNERVTSVAKEVGLDYHLSDARPGNTFDAHRLLHYAASKQLGDQAGERLMQAYFSESLPVGERAELARLAPEFGIPEDEALKLLESKEFEKEVRADEARATAFGITGVPFFVFNEQFGVSGAQPIETFTKALLQAANS